MCWENMDYKVCFDVLDALMVLSPNGRQQILIDSRDGVDELISGCTC